MPVREKGLLKTRDNVAIAYECAGKGRASCVIICPGFFNSMKNRWMQECKRLLSERFDTALFDFRGHGESGGRFCWLARERYDLEAVLAHVKRRGYGSIGILGFSLGAATAINTVACAGGIAGMVLVSAPTGFWDINYHFWEPGMLSDLRDNWECGWEGKGVRIGNMFLRKPRPLTQIRRFRNVPILFIHGDRDWIIKDSHARALYDAYAGEKQLAVIKGGLHAERLLQCHREKTQKLIMDWLTKTLEVGHE